MIIDELKERLVGKKIRSEKSGGEEWKTDGVIADIRPINEYGSVDVFLKNHVSPYWCFRKEEIETLVKRGCLKSAKVTIYTDGNWKTARSGKSWRRE